MSREIKHLYEFGPFVLDPSERLLRHGAARMELPPRAFDTLLTLVENNGHLLDKDALMQTVWGDTVVEENNLSQVVYLLRKALRDGEDGTSYIETVPKRGYRFVASVRKFESGDGNGNGVQSIGWPASSLEPNALPGASVPTKSSSANGGAVSGAVTVQTTARAAALHQVEGENGFRVASRNGSANSAGRDAMASHTWMQGVVGGLAVLALVVMLQAMGWKRGLFSESTTGPIRSVAVLPLQNLSNDPNQEYFVDGMTDELITDLAQIRELKVVSKTSIMQYKSTHTPLPQIGRDLKVDAVVEGSVLRSGDRVRITAQLIRTATDRHIWAKAYDGDLRDVLSLQARVAEEITNQVRLNLTPEESGRLHKIGAVDPEVLDLYLHGRFAWNQRTAEGFHSAVKYFNQAIDKEPNFALAYSGLADAYTLLALYGENTNGMSNAKAAAEKALQLDPTLAEAHTSLAAVKILHDWDWQGAEDQFHRALELNPNFAQAHQWYGNLLLGPEGRHEEAIIELQRAEELDPFSLIIRADAGFAYFLAGRNAQAIQSYQKVLAANPNFLPVHFYLSQYYRETAQYDLWIKESAENDRLAGNPRGAEALEKAYARGGFHGVMEDMAREAGSGSALNAAQADAALGRNAAALAALEQCFKVSPDGLIFVKVDPVWKGLRSEPRFQDLLRKMHLQ